VNIGGQLSVTIVDKHKPPSTGEAKTHKPVGVVVTREFTSHCSRLLQPVLWTGSQTATVPEQAPLSAVSPGGPRSVIASAPVESSPEGPVVVSPGVVDEAPSSVEYAASTPLSSTLLSSAASGNAT
jgi:hypothetical protein